MTSVTTKRGGAIELIEIARAKAGPVVLAPVIGGGNAPAVTALRNIAEAAGRLGVSCAEISESLAGPAQRGTMKRESAGRILPTIEQHAQAIASVRNQLAKRVTAATTHEGFGDTTPYWKVQEAHELVRMFNHMNTANQAMTLFKATYEPAQHASWARALLSVDSALTPTITPEQRRDLAVASFASREPQTFAAMNIEVQQLAAVVDGVRRATDFVAEVTGSREDVVTLAPTAGLVAREPGVSWGASQRVIDTFLEA